MLKIKRFGELTTDELYRILQVREEIFVLEQKCFYQDLDDIDCVSLHVFEEDNGVIGGYLRAYQKDEKTVQIGRVLIRQRGMGRGKKLMENGIAAVRERMKPEKICIEAQEHATGFYEKLGFRVASDVFMDAGIPHVAMELEGFEKA